MSKKSFISTLILAVCSCIAWPNMLRAQGSSASATEGTLTFTVKTVSNGTGYSPKHVLAIWIKDSVGDFVISRKVMANTRKKHLVKWVASSANNTTNAITGSTLSTHQTHTITWDGKDISGNETGDGVYQVWVEYTSQNSANGQPAGPSTSVYFHKGPVADHQAPANLTYFQDMVLDWVPAGVGINEPEHVPSAAEVFPNPFRDQLTVKLKLEARSQVQAAILDCAGRQVANLAEDSAEKGTYAIRWDGKSDSGEAVPPGLYFLRLTINGKTTLEKLVRE